MGVNGSVLPATVALQCQVLAGELRLDEDGCYRLALTARYQAGAGAGYTKVLESAGTWPRSPEWAIDPKARPRYILRQEGE